MIILLIVTIFGNIAKSQEETHIEEITVIAPYEPTISDAFKINLVPKIKDEIIEKPEFSYSIKSKIINTPVQLTPITPAKILGEPISKLYKNYVKLGFGSYTTPYFEFFANKLRSKKNSFGVHLKHLSSTGNIKDYANNDYSENEINIFAKKFYSRHTLSGNVFYKRNVYHFYGYKPEDYPYISLSKDDLKQKFSLIGAKAKFNSTYTYLQKLNHSFSLKYYYLSDNYKTNEQNINFNAEINKNIELFDFTNDQNLGLIADVDFFINNDSIISTNNAIIKLQPFYKIKFNEYKFYIGLNASVEADTISYVHFYPIVRVEIDVIKNMLNAYAGITGNMKKNNFKAFSDENPFIISTIPMTYSYNKFEIFGGIKGNFSKEIDYCVNVSSSNTDQMPFFVADTNEIPNNKFTVVYDDVKFINAKAEIAYQEKEKIRVMLRANYYEYSMTDELKPWHKPEFDICFAVNYNIQNKIIVKAELFMYGKKYVKFYKNNELTAEKINGITDINLGLEYRYSKILSAFVNFNNIGNLRYYKWYNYPSQRFNLMAGITYSF
ncbi:MAG: hypothetical protein K8R58_02025 [Bacteroidales bacterium]|nr:hypothetical protein [Bacteroidales bacterium]